MINNGIMKDKGSLTHIRKEVFGIEIREQKDGN